MTRDLCVRACARAFVACLFVCSEDGESERCALYHVRPSKQQLLFSCYRNQRLCHLMQTHCIESAAVSRHVPHTIMDSSSVLSFLRDTSIGGKPKCMHPPLSIPPFNNDTCRRFHARKEILSQLFVRRIGCFEEQELPCAEWKFDKAFSAVRQFLCIPLWQQRCEIARHGSITKRLQWQPNVDVY